MDRILVAGAFLLLILEISLLVSDFDGRSAGRSLHANSSRSPMIGEMVKTENLVRRRAHNSLTWDESRNDDDLFEADSVLTLAGSSARIRLGTDTTLNLDENTLIVLESNEKSSNGSIRIRFARGNMRTRNNGQPLEVDGGTWTLEAGTGSVVSLVALADGKFGVEVEEGQAEVASPKGKESVSKGESAVIHESGIQEKKKISSLLKWEPQIPKRIYTRSFPVALDLKWSGTPERLEIVNPDRESNKIENPEANAHQLGLMEGTYFFRLEEGDQISESLAVQVRRAPETRYFTPLPRDRVPTNTPTLFAWEPIPGAKGYRLELSTSLDFSGQVQHFDTKEPRYTTELRTEGSLHWRVIAIDSEGWSIPAPRSYPLFAIPQPLQAPQLNPPVIREPASEEQDEMKERKGASHHFEFLFDLAFPKAEAQHVEQKKSSGRLEAEFTWAEVPGADHYMIEIAKNPTFSDPIAIERVNNARFVWKNVAPGVYFWRVAAGRMITVDETSTEQIGLFSPPTLVRLEQAPPPPPIGPKIEVAAATPSPPPAATPVISATAAPQAVAEQTTDEEAGQETAQENAQEIEGETETVPMAALSPSFKPQPPPQPTPSAPKAKTRDERLAEKAAKERYAKLEEQTKKMERAKRQAPPEEIVPLPPKLNKEAKVAQKDVVHEAETSAHEEPVPVAMPPTPAESSHEIEEPLPPSRALSGHFWLAPSYRISQAKNEQEIEGAFKGFVPLAFDGELVLPATKRMDLELLLHYSDVTWKPKGSVGAQADLKETRYGLDFTLHPLGKYWSFGAGGELLPLFTRTQAEAGEFRSIWLYGPTARFHWNVDSFETDIRLSPRFGDGLSGGKLSSSWVYHFYKRERIKTSIGPSLQGAFFNGAGGKTMTDVELGLLLGIGW